VIDALLQASGRIDVDPVLRRTFQLELEHVLGCPVGERRIVLVTGHRRENFGSAFRSMCSGLRQIAEDFPDLLVVYPVHLNPNVRLPVHEILGSVATSG